MPLVPMISRHLDWRPTAGRSRPSTKAHPSSTTTRRTPWTHHSSGYSPVCGVDDPRRRCTHLEGGRRAAILSDLRKIAETCPARPSSAFVGVVAALVGTTLDCGVSGVLVVLVFTLFMLFLLGVLRKFVR